MNQPNPVLVDAVQLAREAAVAADTEDAVGDHVGVQIEDSAAVTHLFQARKPGYPGWQWAVTVAVAGQGAPVTISEVVLLPGSDALVAPNWVPWENRVRAGDLGVGDILPTAADDPRLIPGYLASGDIAVDEIAKDMGIGLPRVLSRLGREVAAERWEAGEFGPHSDMAALAPAGCGRCGFYQRLAGSLGAVFGVCANELSPADGHVVHVEYGCGAHSEAEVSVTPTASLPEVVYDDARLDVE